jgi:beta-mannosidase
MAYAAESWALTEGWELASSPPGACAGPAEIGTLDWHPARVPGTAAAAIGADGRDFDTEDWWFRVAFERPTAPDDHRVVLELDGIATVSEVYLNGERVLESESMWEQHALDVSERLRDNNQLAIACRALKPLMSVRRRPSARWRTRVVNEGNLRWYRTIVFGRSPGFAPGPAAVGPWRPVRVVARAPVGVDELTVRTRLKGDDGVVHVRARVRDGSSAVEISIGNQRVGLLSADGGWGEATLRLRSVQRWWPHTHGEPYLHELSVELDGERVSTRRVGFRELRWADEIATDGLDLHVNGIPLFIRGAVWTPSDLVSLAPSADELRALLERVRDAGMNMLRVVGTGAYESDQFHDLCDEFGILVWQDLMFANLDYPVADPDFRAVVEREARWAVGRLAWRPSLAVVCGNSEVEQQPAMLGLDPALGRDDLWEHRLAEIVGRELEAGCAYLPSTPTGGDLPFHVNRGVGHYFGVSGYMRPAEDARRADVRFASECLAFANIPDEVEVPVHHPRWKAGVARDAGTGWDLGAGWDFDDVRDWYVEHLFGVDSVQLRRSDHARYLELSRAASGEVMAEVIGEWRRDGSPCRGALVLWLKDMLPGAGLGVIDHAGTPKVAYHHLRRAMAPVAVWSSDEGVNGVALHVANDRDQPLGASLRVAIYRDLEARVAEAEEQLDLAAHSSALRTVEGMLGHFIDAAWAYRFGPPAGDAIVVSLESGGKLLSQSFRFLGGRPIGREPAARLGLEVGARQADDGTVAVTVTAQRLAYGVRLGVPGFASSDDAFSIEPGGTREVLLHPVAGDLEWRGGSLAALNLDGSVKIDANLG